MGRPRRRHGAARADRGLRRRHRDGRAQVRRPLRARDERHRARRLRNDSVATALEVAEALGDDLWGVRLDTSDKLADLALQRPRRRGAHRRRAPSSSSSCASARRAGFPDVRIVVSGGFTAERIRAFEAAGVPVDAYGVGSSLIRGSNDFTADVVMVDGQPRRQGRARAAPERPPQPGPLATPAADEAHALEARCAARRASSRRARAAGRRRSTGATSRPPGRAARLSARAGRAARGGDVDRVVGRRLGQARAPSPTTSVTFSTPAAASSRAPARTARRGARSIHTWAASRASSAAW